MVSGGRSYQGMRPVLEQVSNLLAVLLRIPTAVHAAQYRLIKPYTITQATDFSHRLLAAVCC